MRKVGVIGLGAVGSAACFMLVNNFICNELYLYDINEKAALGAKHDLDDSLYFSQNKIKIIAAKTLSELINCDIIVLSFCFGGAELDRVMELKNNYKALKTIIAGLNGFCGKFIVATNPNDSIVYHTKILSGFSCKNVIGTGTFLDSSRLRVYFANEFNTNINNIHANMIGEHGDTQFMHYSEAKICGICLDEFYEIHKKVLNIDDIEKYIRYKGNEIFLNKGKTEFGIGSAIARMSKAIFDNEKLCVCASFVDEDIAFSRPVIIGKDGIEDILPLKLNDIEQEKLYNSKKYIRNAIESVL